MSSHTLSWVLDATTQYFEKQRVDAPRATAEHLAARLLRCKRAELPLHAARELTEAQLEAMRRGMKRAADGEPLQYILGQWDFRSLTLHTDSRALIPRPETEQLVDLVLASNALRASDAPLVLDYGTGSGCIALSIAKECPKARVFAVDISSDALALAAENAASLGLQDRVFLIDLTQRDL